MLPILESAKQEILDALTSKLAELYAGIGETADTGGTQTTGTVNAKLNAILQKQRVIRGSAKITYSQTGGGTGTITLPQTIDPDYANISVNIVGPRSSDNLAAVMVTRVTTTTIDVQINMPGYSGVIDTTVAWQVVGGVV